MPLMDRINITSFLSLSYEEQLTKVRSVQLFRSDGLKEAAQKKIRKESKKSLTKLKKEKTIKKQKALTAIDNMSLEQLSALAKKFNLTL